MAKENTLIDLAIEVTPLALMGWLGFTFYDKIFNDPNAQHGQETIKGIEAQIQQEINKGTVPTYTEAQYKILGDKLQSAMEGMGTDEEAVYGVFAAMYNNLDFLNLYSAFGVRLYHEFFTVEEQYDLSQWIDNEFSTYGVNVINNILAQRGISYTV